MKNYEYPFTHYIVFSLVMRDEEICRGVLQAIFPDRAIEEVKLHEDYLETEKTIITGIESHQVRLDVLFKDSAAWYNIDMQVRDEHNLPKRTRYVHASIDSDALKPGQDYNTLPPSYVIFICCFDYFGEDKDVYRFSMKEEEKHLSLSDENYTIIVNSKASRDAVTTEALRELFDYINEAIVPEGNQLLEKIDHSVETWNTGEGRRAIMTLEQEILIKVNKAREEAHAEGREEGLAEGREEGLAEGREEGLAEGREEGQAEERERNEQEKRDSAKKLKEGGVPLELIAASLNIPIDEI